MKIKPIHIDYNKMNNYAQRGPRVYNLPTRRAKGGKVDVSSMESAYRMILAADPSLRATARHNRSFYVIENDI